MRQSERKRRKIVIGMLCSVLLLMAIGYAAFASQLNIKGTTGISSNWDIEITNIRGGNPDGGDAYDISEPTYTPAAATFNTGLKTPDTNRVYEVEITNKGTLKGIVSIANLSCGNNDAIYCETFESDMQEMNSNGEWGESSGNGFNIEPGQHDYSDVEFTIAPGEKHYLYMVVAYDDVTSQPENLSANINLELTYEQATTDSSGSIIPSGVVTVYRNTTDRLSIGDSIEGIETTSDYTTLNTNIFLKHNVRNNNILSTEVCFIKDGNTSCLKLNKFERNKEKLIEVFGESACSMNFPIFSCKNSDINAYAQDSYGYVGATVGSSSCTVGSNGYSYCEVRE